VHELDTPPFPFVLPQAANAMQSIAIDNVGESTLVTSGGVLLLLRALSPVTLKDLGQLAADSAMRALLNMVRGVRQAYVLVGLGGVDLCVCIYLHRCCGGVERL
jgi:hypothetical protein